MDLINFLCRFGGMQMTSATPSKVSQIVASPLGEGCHNRYMLAYGPLE